MAAVTLEDVAYAIAACVVHVCRNKDYPTVSMLGGSFGALMAQKVGVVALQMGAVQPTWICMNDPPPPGPCTRCFIQPALVVASQIVRLGREIVGLQTDANTLGQLMGRPLDEWKRVHQAMNDPIATVAWDPDEDWTLAIVATEQLAAIGQANLCSAAIERTKRRMDVYRKCMQLWHNQDAHPVAYKPDGRGGIMLITSTGRWDWFRQIYDEELVECLDDYGLILQLVELEGEHTAMVQAVCTNNLPSVTSTIRSFLEQV
jgi:hypothetical protein